MELKTIFGYILHILLSINIMNVECCIGVKVLRESAMDFNDELLIVNEHNRLRHLVAKGKLEHQPKGINLKQMVYDPELGRKAQKVAYTCRASRTAVYDARWISIGQNVVLRKSSIYYQGPNWNRTINEWFAEHLRYHFPNIPSKDTNHYTQIVGAKSNHIGCGFLHFIPNGSNQYHEIYVCNYGPGGSKNSAPYEPVTYD